MSTGSYQKKQRKALKNIHKRYQNLWEEEKSKKQKYDCERYKKFFMKKKKTKGVSRTVSAIKNSWKWKTKTGWMQKYIYIYCIMQKNRGWTTLFLVEYKKAFFSLNVSPWNKITFEFLERQKN